MRPTAPSAVLPVLSAVAPNEICVTLYFERLPTAVATASQLRHQLRPAVADWQPLSLGQAASPSNLAAIYQAAQPPAGFASVHLLAFESTFSLHTEVVQLILSSYEPYASAWSQAADWLTTVLAPTLRTPPDTTGLLGYTLVYRANVDLDPAVTSLLTLDPAVLRAARSIHQLAPVAPASHQVRAQQPVAQGWLLLVEYPQAPAQGLVYVALGQADKSDELADAVFAGPAATLVTQDIFVHKTLAQSWTANRNYDTYNTDSLTPFKNSITSLLQVVDNPRLKSKQLDRFAQELAHVTHTQWNLNRLEQSILQQLNGLRRQFAYTELPAIARHHITTLESHQQEVQALVRQHQLVTENARAAIALVEAQETKHANVSQRRFNQLIALGGILFAAFSAFDKDLVQIWQPAASCLDLYAYRLGLAIITVLITGLAYQVFKQYQHWSRNRFAR